MHNMQSVLLGENPLRGVSPRLRVRGLATILTPDEVTPTAGPLPEGIVGLVLGRSSLS